MSVKTRSPVPEPLTCTAVSVRAVRLPSPNCPWPPSPQQYAAPDAVTPHMCSPPPAIFVSTAPPGPTAFGLANAGKVPHEVIIIRLRPNANVQDILRLDRADSTWRDLRDPPSGILTADPGVTTPGQLLVNLQVGERYLLVCNFRDTDTAPAHLHLGMMKLITVHASDTGE